MEQLCKDIPKEFAEYLTYVRQVKFEEKPDYKLLRKKFRTLFVKSGYDYDYRYDWVIQRKRKLKSKKHSAMRKRGKNTFEQRKNNLLKGASELDKFMARINKKKNGTTD